MGQIGISIEMDTAFRGGVQPFSNVFHYQSVDPAPPTSPLPLVNEVVGIMKNLHSTAVNFRNARMWTSGGDKFENEMIFETPLTGAGVHPDVPAFDRERAVLMQWPAGKNVLGKPVFLRKWFHCCGRCVNVAWSNDVMANKVGLTQAEKDLINTEANKLRIIGALDEWLLCAQSGREHTGPGTVHNFLEHRQLGDQWR